MAQIYLNGSECCGVERSDRVGFVNELSVGALGYQLESHGVDNWFARSPFNGSMLPTVGDVVTFDTLSVPYAFALTAAYDTGMIDSVSADIDVVAKLRIDNRCYIVFLCARKLSCYVIDFRVSFQSCIGLRDVLYLPNHLCMQVVLRMKNIY